MRNNCVEGAVFNEMGTYDESGEILSTGSAIGCDEDGIDRPKTDGIDV